MPEIGNIKSPFSIDGHKWMKRLRLPYYWVAKLREMRVGDELIIGSFSGPGMGSKPGKSTAYFRKETGKWFFEGGWLITLHRKQHPPHHIWASGYFKLEKGSIITFLENTTPETEKSFVRICRYISWVNKSLLSVEKKAALQSMHLPLWRGDLIRNGLNKRGMPGPSIDPVQYLIVRFSE